jgi:hypothetical protein
LALAAGLALVALAAGLLLAGTPWLGGAGEGDWLSRALASRLSIICIALTTVGALCLALLLGLLHRLGAPNRRRRRDGEEGTAILEFAMVLPIMLYIVLVMAQASLLLAGNLCVHYSAYCAARSAIVQVPLNIDMFEGPNVLRDQTYSTKMFRIRQAALWALMPVSSAHPDLPRHHAADITQGIDGYFRSLGERMPHWAREDYIGRKMTYADDHTLVELDEPEDQPSVYPWTYKDDEDLHITVRHVLYLSIPYANRLFTDVLDRDNGRELGFAPSAYGLMIEATSTLTNEGVQDYIDREWFPGDP